MTELIAGIPSLTRTQVREIDRISIDEYHIPGIVLMENASRGAAAVIVERYLRPDARRMLVLCGGGNNGGDGLAIARHLHNAGASVSIGLYVDLAKYAGDAQINWQIVQAMSLPTFPVSPPEVAARAAQADLIVDAIFGTGLAHTPREPFAQVAGAINRSGKPVVAIDIPSGLDCDTGRPLGDAVVRADLTITFVAPKQGFRAPGADDLIGSVVVRDIGCPPAVITRVRCK